MPEIAYPVCVVYLREKPLPGDGATVNDAAGKLICVTPLHEHAAMIADALNFCAEVRAQRVMEVQP